MSTTSSLLALAACAAVLSPASVRAQVPVPGEPQITVRLNSIRSTGGIGATAGDTKRFVVGEPFTLLLVAGNLERGDTSICSIGGYSSRRLDELVARFAHVWRVDVTPLEYAAGQQKLALEWARFRTGPLDKPAAGGSYTITLGEGDRHVLDFLQRDPSNKDCGASAVLLDVSAGFREDAAYADATLRYELWLVHRDKSGETMTRQFATMGRQGVEMPYGFPSHRFATPDVSGATRQYDVLVTLNGAIRGRLLPDGNIALELTTDRHDGLRPREGSGDAAGVYSERLGLGLGSGRKLLTVAPGETIEIKIPSRSGVSMVRAGDAPLSVGVGGSGRGSGNAPPVPQEAPIAVENGAVRVDWKRFFQGHDTSLIVKVTRVQ